MSIFSLVKDAAGDEPRSFGWYRDNVKTLFKISDLYADLVQQEETLTPVPGQMYMFCLLYTSPSPRDLSTSRMPSSA